MEEGSYGGLTVDDLVADQALQEYADEAHEAVLHVLVLQGRGSRRGHSATCHEVVPFVLR